MAATLYDKNNVFFGLIHYILSEQKNVNWILKTSLIDFTGISSLLEEKPYKKESILDDVVDYVTEIKPYHVQFSHYFEHYQTASESVTIPGNDWIEPTIGLRFDAVQSYPDINKQFYSIVTTTPTSTETKYNVDGLTIYNSTDKKFYVRTYNTGNWSWVQSDEVLSDGYYYTTSDKVILKSLDNTLTPISQITNGITDFINSHKANRLFYLGIHDKEEIKKELNANFKGIELNGSVFDIENFGYDIFNYDTTDYDSPTTIYDYFFVDSTEDLSPYFTLEEGYTYTKKFESTSEHRFSIPSSLDAPSGYTTKVYKVSPSGTFSSFNDYELSFSSTGNYLDIFNPIQNNEKVYVVVESDVAATKPNISIAYIIAGTYFVESSSSVLRREIVNYTPTQDMYLLTPASGISSTDKIAVQIKTLSGDRKPYSNITSYTISDNKLRVLPSTIHVGEHIIMTSFDYKYLYDKIYTFEDRYGRSNNIINFEGKGLIRPRYEEDRPSERIVSYPLSSLFCYTQDDSSNYMKVLFNDYKNNITDTSYNRATAMYITGIEKDDNKVLTSITLDNVKTLRYPSGRVLINSEILEYSSLNKSTKTISNFKRGLNGTPVYNNLIPKYQPKKMTHAIGDVVYPYVDEEWTNNERSNVYKSYNITNPLVKTYKCPSGYTKTSDIELYKNKRINLLEDVYDTSTEIIIDSANVVSGSVEVDGLGNPIPLYKTIENGSTTKYYGDWSLKINDDIVPFTLIYKDPDEDSTYHIGNITLPDKYKNLDDVVYYIETAVIQSCIPEEVDSFSVSFIEGDMTNNIVTETVESETKTYVVTSSNEKIYRLLDIKSSTTYTYKSAEVYKCSQEYDGWTDTFKYVETSYGYIQNNKLYKNDGTLIAKIEGTKCIDVQTIITLLEDPKKYESIHINVIN